MTHMFCIILLIISITKVFLFFIRTLPSFMLETIFIWSSFLIMKGWNSSSDIL